MRARGPRGLRYAVAGLAVAAGLALAGTANAQAVNHFGAISIDPVDGSSGFAYNYRTRAAAEARSLRECRVRSSTGACRTIAWVRNGCVAAAVVRRPNGSLRRIAWGIGVTRAQAQNRARARAGVRSRVLVWTCTAR